ncbi:MAG: hypothetical protein U0992_13220 [Planctomycetaceae bacterium]
MVNTEQVSGGASESIPQRVGIQVQPAAGDVFDRLDDARRRRIRVFVRVELGPAGILRLLAGDVRVQAIDAGTEERHGLGDVRSD